MITPIGKLVCFGPTLFVAKRNKFDPTKDPRFDAFLIFDSAVQATPEYAALRAALSGELVNCFGARLSQIKERLKLPLKPGGLGEKPIGVRGDMVLRAWSATQPQVVDGSLQTITVPGDVWSGQLARFEVNCKGFDKAGSVGANFYLNNVQITSRDMPRLDGRVSADKVFGKIDEEVDGSALGRASREVEDDMPF
jgi:hypothetical protein